MAKTLFDLIRKGPMRWPLFLSKYVSIGGQAVIEGVMMRSPNSFVIAVRKPDGKIKVRWDQWYGLSKRFDIFKKPFLRGVLVLFETMANGIVSLNYSANIAMDEEMRQDAIKKGISEEEYEKSKKNKEKVGWGTILSLVLSMVFGIGLFVFLPHGLTILLERFFGANWGLDTFSFHAVDGLIKGCIFISYIFLIGLFPDVKRVFQYHGAEHKSISTFEAGEELVAANAVKYPTFHPRCGTTFVFFLLFISIVLFTIIFALVPVGKDQPALIKHLMALGFKLILTFPVAGVSYELIKLMGNKSGTSWGKFVSFPGRLLQKLTTREPTPEQLEVALVSIKAALYLEDKYKLKSAQQRIFKAEEIEINNIGELEDSTLSARDFLES